MKLSERWLREWVNPPIASTELMQELTMAGLEVESTQNIGSGLDLVKVGQIVEAERHPNADRLQVCQVDVGADQLLHIVCGAANARKGLKVAVALIGANLPGDFKIKPAKIRGVDSQGMLCSSTELGLGETANGIIEFPADAPVGMSIHEYLQLPDNMIDINVTPNRGDCFSIKGIAREVAVINQLALRAPAITAVKAMVDERFPIQVIAEKDCPRFLGRVIRNVNLQACTPIWMQERLRRSGIRSINPVVDVTNYVMLELGQPSHAYDLEKLQGAVQVRYANVNESLTLLDGQEMILDPQSLVIADSQEVLGLAGIMGGINSGINDNTKHLFIEAAFFDPMSVALTARRYHLFTDASARFERGVDPNLAPAAMERITELLLSIVGGEPGPVTEVVFPEQLPQHNPVTLRRQRIPRLLGINVDDAKVKDILERLEMKVQASADGWNVIAPSHRFDISLEEDLIEEIARIYGYDNIPARALVAPLTAKLDSEHKVLPSSLRSVLVDKGYHETINYSFIDPKLHSLLDPAHAGLFLSNPISADMAVMRSSLWPGLLQGLLFNSHRQQERVRLFEMGLCFILQDGDLQQIPKIAGIALGSSYPEQWSMASVPMDFYDMKGDVEALLDLTRDSSNIHFQAAQHVALHPGQAAAILRKDKVIGYVGALHPLVLQKLDIKAAVYVFELSLPELEYAQIPRYDAPSKYPLVRRDIAFTVEQTIPAQQLQDKIKATAGELLKFVHIFDIYQGENIESGKKSVAMGLTFQHPSRTLIDQEIDEVIQTIIKMLKREFNATLRA